MTKTIVVFNPHASGAHRSKPLLRQLAKRHGCEVWTSEYPLTVERLVQRAREHGCRRLIVAGGDGAVARMVNALADDFSWLELAILPLGTGNDLARSLGLPLDDLPRAFEFAMTGRVARLDLGRMTNGATKYFINAAAGGFGGRVASDVSAADKERFGPFAYWITAVGELANLQEHKARIVVDGVKDDLLVYGLVVANGRNVGGGFPIAPLAMLCDGLLDVTAIPVLPMLELLASGLHFTLGPEHFDRHIKTYRGRQIYVHASPEMIFSVDGETSRHASADFEILPAALPMVVGDPAPACDLGER